MFCNKCGKITPGCGCSDQFYDEDTVLNIKHIYLVSIIIWFIVIYLLELWTDDILSNLLLFIPPIVYLMTFFSIGDCTKSLEDFILQEDILAFGVIIITTVFSAEHSIHTAFMAKLMVVGLFILSLSFIDFCVPKADIITLKHVKSITRLAAMTIFIYAFYAYFIAMKIKTKVVVNPMNVVC